MKICSLCGKPGDQKCGGCRTDVYCSISCQKAAWPAHRDRCRAAARESKGELSRFLITRFIQRRLSASSRTGIRISAPTVTLAPIQSLVAASSSGDGTVRFAAGADGGCDNAVWAIPMDVIFAKLPELLPLSPAMILGGAAWTQHVWYHGDISPSGVLAARFRAAHAISRSGSGKLQTEIEQELLANPVVYLGANSVDNAQLAYAPRQLAWMLGARFVMTPLSPAIVRSIVRFASQLQSARVGFGGMVDVRSSVAGVGSAGQAHAASQMLEWALNTPPYSAAYAFCVGASPADDTVVITGSGELDEDKLQLATRRVIPRPTPAQRCVSRLACFFCGAHPLSKGVQMRVCGGCDAVAYCSTKCATIDWTEHHRECGRVNPRSNGRGLTALPAYGLSISRGGTECNKAMSARSPVILPAMPASAGMWTPALIERIALIPTVGVDGITVTRLWLVDHGSGGDLESALSSALRG